MPSMFEQLARKVVLVEEYGWEGMPKETVATPTAQDSGGRP